MANEERPNDKLIAKKTEWAAAKRPAPSPRPGGVYADRLPPGQHVAEGWPVLDLGVKPEVTTEKWSLTVDGLVAVPRVLDWTALLDLPQSDDVSDFHCVTTWSTFDNRWRGTRFKDLCAAVKPSAEARHVVFSSYDGYTTNLPLAACLDDDVMIVPKRYAWKSAKWLRAVTFLAADAPGFWEVRGYSNTAFPWDDDRFSE